MSSRFVKSRNEATKNILSGKTDKRLLALIITFICAMLVGVVSLSRSRYGEVEKILREQHKDIPVPSYEDEVKFAQENDKPLNWVAEGCEIITKRVPHNDAVKKKPDLTR